MGRHAVLAHSQHHCSLLPELRIQLAKGAGLLRAACGHILRIKIEDHLLTAVIFQGVILSVLIRQRECRRLCSF